VKLLISHQDRDEGSAYYQRIVEYARLLKVDLVTAGSILGTQRSQSADGQKVYDLWDCYANADFVTYPSSYEGFGNAFLEAVFYRKPILVNRYSIFESDIEPLGFEVVLIDNFVTEETLTEVRHFLDDAEARSRAVEHNFALGQKFFSFELLEQKLKAVIGSFGTVG
jgi:glycosyltransferase involved in cell wall biosynthesis